MKTAAILATFLTLFSTTHATEVVLPGPDLPHQESGWFVCGIQLTALRPTILLSAEYPNAGLGATVILRDGFNVVMRSVPIDVGNVNAVIPLDVAIWPGETYHLLALTANGGNSFFANYAPASSDDIGVVSGWGSADPADKTMGQANPNIWFGFRNLRSDAGLTPVHPTTWGSIKRLYR